MITLTFHGTAYEVKFDHNHPSAPTLTVATVRDAKTKRIVREAVVRKYIFDKNDIKEAERQAIIKALKPYDNEHMTNAFLSALK